MAKLVIFGSDGRRDVELVEHNTMGRLPQNRIQILDRIVSKEHCDIYLDKARGYVFKDLGSLNGSYVNKARVSGEIELRDGDEITMGNTRCIFYSEDAGTKSAQQTYNFVSADEAATRDHAQHASTPVPAAPRSSQEPAVEESAKDVDPLTTTLVDIEAPKEGQAFTAAVLRAIRNDGPLSNLELHARFCPPQPPGSVESCVFEMTHTSQLKAALKELTALGLIEHTTGGEYRKTDQLDRLQVVLGISLSELMRPRRDRRLILDSTSLGPEIVEVCEEFEGKYAHEWFGPDLASDLREIATCLDFECYRAALSVAGRALELTLKLLCERYGVYYQNDWMVGKLLGALSEHVDSPSKSIGSIINEHRIANVHALPEARRPTRDQANMVCHALLDIVRRQFLAGGDA